MSDPGPPLGKKDFFQATQLPVIPTNTTTDQLMKIIANGELKGAINKPDDAKSTKNGLATVL